MQVREPTKVMSEFYRFRTVEKLLKPFEELESQTIFFAGPEELNDPMEGLQSLVWDGDQVVWVNLFKHYVHCLAYSFLEFCIDGQESTFEASDIRVELTQNRFPTSEMAKLFGDVWQKVRSECELDKVAESIAGLEGFVA